MPTAMTAAPASATLLAKGNRREWLMMNSRVIRSSRVAAILLRFVGQSNSFIRRFATPSHNVRYRSRRPTPDRR
ncbi:hypothetical protein FD827_14975 [Klebsiella pneumoniae]|nr:hypothetical protein [Klebsiella pneumoniae]MBZ7744144.1 hypothetical protein [Klebsiella variicola]NIG48133.1 hypothetical protein [Klebsiella sp. Ap-874]OWW17406.1 hypothetical protein BUE65_04210 [Klebsiella variicola]PXH96129.1 hypothetical protein DMQ94_26305 [Klebsiella variicola]